MKKLILCMCCLFLINSVFSDGIDDSKYNDPVTLEFSLCDSKGHTFCLYHNIKNIKDVDFTERKDVLYSNWSKIDSDDFSVTWNDENGAIVILKTKSSAYMTRRGIKVGDSISKIKDVYKDFSLWQTDYKGKVIVGFSKANMLEEEMMTLAFWTEKGIVTNIEIVVGENESWIDRN